MRCSAARHHPLRPRASSYRPQRIEIVEAAHLVPDVRRSLRSAPAGDDAGPHGRRPLSSPLISGGGSVLPACRRRARASRTSSNSTCQLFRLWRVHPRDERAAQAPLSASRAGACAGSVRPRWCTPWSSATSPATTRPSLPGPTVPDASTCADALSIASNATVYSCRRRRSRACSRVRSKPPSPGDPRFAGHRLQLIATPRQPGRRSGPGAPRQACTRRAARRCARRRGTRVGAQHAALARHGCTLPAALRVARPR